MAPRSVRVGLRLGILVGAALMLAKILRSHRPVEAPLAWVEPQAGRCPPSYPVKAKLSSGIFHLPGMFAYDRTHPDRCYRDARGAEADGFTRAKR